MNCEEASKVCNKLQYNEAGFWEKVKFKIHLLLCRGCARFTKKNIHLTTMINKAPLHCLSKEEKSAMVERLRTKI